MGICQKYDWSRENEQTLLASSALGGSKLIYCFQPANRCHLSPSVGLLSSAEAKNK